MTCEINWGVLSTDDWETRFDRFARSNFLQSYTYARAHCPLARQKARWGLILIDGKEAGLVQVFEAGIFWNLIHAVILDRGPLWFDGCGHAMHLKRFYETFNKHFPKRRGRKRRILPESADGPAARKLIAGQGFTETGAGGIETAWLDLGPDEETLRARMAPDWRDMLARAEIAGLTVEEDQAGAHLDDIAGRYAAEKTARGFGGPSPALFKSYATLLLPRKEILILRAMCGGQWAAFTTIVIHGKAATCFTAWSSEEARASGASHLLLWEGIKRLKMRGIQQFDLGGVHDGDKNFQAGLGGEPFKSVPVFA